MFFVPFLFKDKFKIDKLNVISFIFAQFYIELNKSILYLVYLQ